MSFIASVFTAIIDVVVSIVEVVVQIVEMVVKLIMVLLGWDGGSTQIIEYFEVRNYPIFEDVDRKNPTTQTLLQAILAGQDVGKSLIYKLVFRSLKADIKKYMNFIEDGNYFEGFPELDSYILIIDYDELTGALQTLTGVACTVETAYLRALSKSDWVKYWLQENQTYNVGTNVLGAGTATVTTSPITAASTEAQSINFNLTISDEIATSDSVVINSGSAIQTSPGTSTSSYTISNEFILNITDEIATSDSVVVDQSWYINLNTISYNSVADTYNIPAYQNNGTTITLPYTAPSRPTQLHYVSTYYQNATPSRIYLFIYQVGAGTYTELDTVEDPINIDNTQLQAIPAVPLRISNANYTTFGATKKQQIEDLLLILNLKAEELINGVMSDSGLAPGDVDNVYVNYGVRMWDTSQAGMSYLFRMFENLYPAQGTTQGDYNNAPAEDDKPTNNILTKTDDKEDAFQWNYITYAFTPLSTINANSGSAENGIYYSDMSKFDSSNILKFPYYSSSGKGTYNVGYKADTLTEVANFLAGNGTPNPGTTTTEGTNWLQVTTRMSYNNTTPVLQDPNGSTSSLIYLTPDAVYENNGSGVLRIVQQASEETTSGQSITYYKIKPSGLAAYTVVAPIAAMRVVDGDSGKFKTVKFNLGAKYDIMVPFIYTFVKDLAATDQAKLFLAGAHISIYVAHYEVIEHAGMSFLTALVMIVIIVVIIAITISSGGADGGSTLQAFLTVVGGTASTAAVTAAIAVLKAKLVTFLINMVVMQVIQRIIVEVVGDNELAMLLTFAASFAVASWDIGVAPGSAPNTAQLGTYGHTGGATIGAGGGSLAVNTPAHYNPQGWLTPKITGATSFSLPSSFQSIASMAGKALDGVNTFYEYKLKSLNEELSTEMGAYEVLQEQRYKKLGDLETILAAYRPNTDSNYLLNATRVLNQGPKSAYAHDLIYLSLNKNQLKFAELDVSSHYNYDVHFLA